MGAPRANTILRAPVLACAALLACSGGGSSAPAGAPALVPSVPSLAFEAAEGGADPAPQTFLVANGGGGVLARPSTSIAYAAASGWLAAEVSGDAAPFTVTVRATTGALPAGVHAATLSVRSNGASNTPQRLQVSVAIAARPPTPVLQLSAASVSFTAPARRGNPPARVVTATNGGGGTLDPPQVTVTYEGVATGWLSTRLDGAAAPYAITLQPVTLDLRAGTHRASVRVESPGAAAVTLPVTLTLTGTWTVLVYASADGPRSTALLRDLQRMSAATLGEAVQVVVAADWSAGRTMPTGEPFPSGTEWYRIVGSGQPPEILATGPEQDFDDSGVLADAVAAALYAYPSERRAVVLWGAAAAWRGGFGGDEQDTPGEPADDGAPMSPDQLAGALAEAAARLGQAAPLDLVGFDAPLALGEELAFALRDAATALVASAGVDQGAGWDYAATLGRLAADPGLTGAALAAGEVQDWDALHAGRADARLRAHAALDLGGMPHHADAWAALGAALTQSADPDWLGVARALWGASPGYGLAVQGDPGAPWSGLRDAGQVLDAIGGATSDPFVATAAALARESLEGVVLARALGDLRGAAQAGVHVEAALGSVWPGRAGGYAALEWDARTRWSDVLWLITGDDDGVAPGCERVLDAVAPSPQTPPRVLVRCPADADVAMARLSVATASGAQVLSRGPVAEVPVTAGDAYHALAWTGTLPTLGDGAVRTAVAVEPWLGGTPALFLVPGTVGAGPGAVDAWALVQDGVPGVEAFAVPTPGGRVVVPAEDLAGLAFTPRLLDAASGAWVAQAPLAIPSDGARLTFERTAAPAGTYRLVTEVADVFGNRQVLADDLTLPTAFGP